MSLGQRLDRLERAVGLNAPCPVCHGTGCTLADSCIVTAEGDEDPPPPDQGADPSRRTNFIVGSLMSIRTVSG